MYNSKPKSVKFEVKHYKQGLPTKNKNVNIGENVRLHSTLR